MIITRLQGGLGNQLFQYAAGKTLALKHRTKLLIDTSAYKINSQGVIKRNLDLFSFKIDSHVASQDDLNSVLTESLLGRIKNKLTPYYKRKIYVERNFHFDPNFFLCPDNRYLMGYWQSELYFKPIEALLRHEFQLKMNLGSTASLLLCQILKTNSTVSLHIRRGDYVSNPETYKVHGLCSINYYTRAIKVLEQKIGKLNLFIFSDDIEWAKKNIQSSFPITFVHNCDAGASFEDLYLMSQCNHNIIANSSYSWWAAWLNNNRHKIVVAPSAWFNEFNADISNLFPQNWTQI